MKQSQVADVKTALKIMVMVKVMMLVLATVTLEMKVLSLLHPSARAPTPWAVSNSHQEMFTDIS